MSDESKIPGPLAELLAKWDRGGEPVRQRPNHCSRCDGFVEPRMANGIEIQDALCPSCALKAGNDLRRRREAIAAQKPERSGPRRFDEGAK